MPRQFPSPDPMERFVHPEEVPLQMRGMDPRERAARLRYFLVCRSRGTYDPLGWHLALALDMKEVWEVVDMWDDARLERAIADGIRRRALGIPAPEVYGG